MKRSMIALCALAMVAWLAGSVLAQGPPRGKPGGPHRGKPGGFQQGGAADQERGSADQGNAGPRRPDPEKIFSYLDKDGDGKLTKKELPERAQQRFSTMDADGDGVVSKEEFLEAHKKMAGRGPGGPDGPGGPGRFNPDQMFQRADTDGDGKVTEKEVPAHVWERLSKADTDSDGAVSKEEFDAAMKKMMEARRGQGPGQRGQGPGQRGQGPGARGQGPGQRGQGPGARGQGPGQRGQGPGGRGGPGQMFQRMDANGDGILTKEEVPAQLWQRIKSADTDGNGVNQEELQKAMPQRQPRRGSGGPGGGSK